MKRVILVFISLLLTCHLLAQTDSIELKTIDDVVVTATRYEVSNHKIPFSISTIGRDVLTDFQRQSILPTITEVIPGIFATSRGMMGYGVSGGAAGGISVRGMSSGTGQVMVLIDGHPQYQGIYGHSIADSYQTMMAEKVEVLRGPASVLYGSNAMGGVINIVTRQAQTDGVHTHINLGAGSYGTFQAEASNQIRKGKFSSTVAAQYGRSDNHRPRMGFEQYGVFAKLGYDINNHWRAYANTDITHFGASQPGTVSAPKFEANQWITRGVAIAGLDNKYKKTNGGVSAYYNWGRHKINDGYNAGGSPQSRLFRSHDALVGVAMYQSASLFWGNTITIGFDYQHIYADAYYTSRATGKRLPANIQTVDKKMDEVAGYIDIHQDVCKWLSANAGVRYDYHTVSGGEWIPQIGIVAKPIKSGEVKLTASKGFRNPTTKELYLYGVANEKLNPERLWNYELAWKHSVMANKLTYGINLFMIKGDNMIQAVMGKNINTGEVNNRGVEAEVDWKVNSHWTIQTNHSVLHMKHHVLGAPEYKGYLGANMKYGKWSINANIQQICGLFTTAGTGNDTKENFTLLNASASYQLIKQLQLWIRGENLLAQRYETIAGYSMPKATVMAGVNVTF